METLVSASRKSYGICLMALGIQQLFYADFRPVFLPALPSLPGLAAWAFVFSAVLIFAGIALIIEKQANQVALLMGGLFLVLFLFGHVVHLVFFNPYGNILGAWTNALKELAFAGGAFVIAGSYPQENLSTKNSFLGVPKKFIPFGNGFFSIVMIIFGIDHFLYIDFVMKLVPTWIPGAAFWSYFAGVALFGAGVCIIFKIKLKLVATLLAIMIFLWFIVLHIPRAIADPFGEKGNEVTSVFQALAFAGIAFIIGNGKSSVIKSKGN